MLANKTTAGKEKIIVGLGKTGLSCARYLSARGERFSVVDTRENPPGLGLFKESFPDVSVVLGRLDESMLLNASEVIVSPGISLKQPAIAAALAKGIPVYGDIDIFSHEANAPILAVTGSNGKSTVVSLLGDMVRNDGKRAGVGGNLDGENAMPALDLLQQETADIYVLELSSFQLETTQNLAAEVATILNISQDHMDRYASMSDYVQAKQRIFLGCRHYVVNRNDYSSEPLLETEAQRWSYGLDSPGENEFGLIADDEGSFLAQGNVKLLDVKEMKLVGMHNILNALAALTMGHAAGLSMPAMVQTLRSFSGLPHRCQWIRQIRGIDFYNDSKATNPGAAQVAIQSIGQMVSGAVILIAGGDGKGADFTQLRDVVRQYVRTLILIGRDAEKMARHLGDTTETILVEDMASAVSSAVSYALPGDAVLLSPACASLDMYMDFRHRGRVFMAAVEALQ
ncbi:MAG: UDP-N-acetylmuramoyl-L-alanine--D-glutamate ligase [Pseudomonadales bacterium]|nr:UDP-N-acetylmuramoyl-L-alanine--D-glutamate ligase [Pseudomonadales bacterium]